MNAMNARPVLPRWCLSMDKKQKMSAMDMDTAADLTASKVVEKRRSCRPQRVVTNSPTPSTTIATTCAIAPKGSHCHTANKGPSSPEDLDQKLSVTQKLSLSAVNASMQAKEKGEVVGGWVGNGEWGPFSFALFKRKYQGWALQLEEWR